MGIQSVPSGLANGLLALVNPIYGLHAYMMGVFTGAFFTSSAFMSVQGTSAMALVVASVPQVTQGSYPNTALFALAILTGVFMLLAGLFNLGSLLRFVPNSVMTGFINAVALLIILGQLDDFTGYASLGGKSFDADDQPAAKHQSVPPADLADRRAHHHSDPDLGEDQSESAGHGSGDGRCVARRESAGRRCCGPGAGHRRNPGLTAVAGTAVRLAVFPYLILPALSMTFVGLMQGASITQSVPNPDGRYPNASGDFIGQGMANLVSGLFQGTTVGGSISATAIVTSAGARSRFANITAGIVIALVIVLFGRLVGLIAMPALAGLLIVVGFRTLKPAEIVMVWKTGLTQDAVMVLTFAAALLVPLQYAVLLGVGLAVLLFVFQQSNKISVKAWKIEPGQYPVEGEPPAVVPPKKVTILVPYGSLFYAAAPVFNSQLPEVTEASQHAVVILALRGKKDVGSTFLQVVTRYARGLQRRNSKLMLVGIAPSVLEQMERTGILRTIGRQNVFMATEGVGQALLQAVDAAEGWIAAQPSGR